MAIAVMAASFLNIYAGISGLIAVCIAVGASLAFGFDKALLRTGVYTFNALITGIGLGTFFDPGIVFFVLLVLISLLSLIISVALGGWSFRQGLPFLSIPFVISFWVIMLPSSELANLGLTQRNIFWMNELYAIGGNSLVQLFQQIESFQPGAIIEVYLRSLSSVFFQDNMLAGLIVAIGLLVASRIFFSLSVIGFLTAYLFAIFVGSEASSISYYNIGANFIMVAIAVGGFFVIPSKASYFWTILLVPVTSLVLLFFIRLLNFIQLPAFSLPYSVVTILFVHFLQQRNSARSLIITPLQQYSPEVNLYSYQNNKDRLTRFLYIPLQLPFWGKWTITQGYDGNFTHKEEWGKALDFMIQDQEGKTFQGTGNSPDQYYCFGKPVSAPADGVITDCRDGIDDNEAGQVNTLQNWGNSVVIQHSPTVYSQLSHLRKNSLKVKKGEFVKAGDVIAQCGNSGRSPYPHLHFQIQSQPHIGARTLEYPIAYFTEQSAASQSTLKQFDIPLDGSTVSNLNTDQLLHKAFNILPDTSLSFSWTDAKGNLTTEHWDAFTDAYNYNYLYSRETGAVAYYTCDKLMFYFTTFYGSKKSLLYRFFLTAYKVLLSDSTMPVTDSIPVHLVNTPGILRAINDFAAPFSNLTKVNYLQQQVQKDTGFDTHQLELSTQVNVRFLKKQLINRTQTISIDQRGIISFSIQTGNTIVYAKRNW